MINKYVEKYIKQQEKTKQKENIKKNLTFHFVFNLVFIMFSILIGTGSFYFSFFISDIPILMYKWGSVFSFGAGLFCTFFSLCLGLDFYEKFLKKMKELEDEV